jgi:hypothetical protein
MRRVPATPLYAVYARQLGFSTVVLALVFAVYVLALIPALLAVGQLPDRPGRQPVIADSTQVAEIRTFEPLHTYALDCVCQ